MRMTESREELITSSENLDIPSQEEFILSEERPLTSVEKNFLLVAERGDLSTVKSIINENQNNPDFDINCVDPLNRSALIAAIENENIELIRTLLGFNIQVKDGLLHAIKEEYVEAVELLLDWEEVHHKPGEPYSWESMDHAASTFTSDITPLILAAHKNNYEIIKILLDRGATLPTPHDVKCGCDMCISSSEQDSLRHSQSRINAYKALSSPSLIALSSKDPLLTAFELSWELRRLSKMETEFRFEYNEMRMQCQTFANSILDHVRNSQELEIMLNYDPEDLELNMNDKHTLERLKLAIKYKQKQFVSHPNVQQLLASIWYEGLPGFRRKGFIGQIIQVAQLGAMFPVYSTIYMMFPTSKMGLFMKKPFVKFICHSASYAFFLMLLGLASQRAEFIVLEFFNTPWTNAILKNWKDKERGAGPGFAEYGVILYVLSLIWNEIKALWNDGFEEYISDLWNIVDFITNIFYLLWISLRMTSFYIVRREAYLGNEPWYPREQWHPFDPMLLSEGAFAAAMIFSFLKLVHIFSVNPHLGPLQISLGRMIIDIIKFFFIYTLVLFAFGCGLNQLLWYYAELEKKKCYNLPNDLPDFDNNEKACSIWRRYANLFETSQSLFWASFGLVDLMTFELTGIKSFTRFWALLMFGSYSVINVIVLLNMLIAMMSNSYQIISERSDTEWKFARTRLWMSYFEEGDTVPPPFNIMPTVKTFKNMFGCKSNKKGTASFLNKSREKATKWHAHTMRLLVRRYVTAEQRKRDDYGITEDDVMEIRQDISTLRYDLIDILRKNGMATPHMNKEDSQIAGKKGRVMERRLLGNFHIGIVEGIFNEAISSSKKTKDVFTQLAKAIGRRVSSKKNQRKDWNTLVRKNTSSDQIGTANEAKLRQVRRQSLRYHIISNKDVGKVEQDKLIEYNPKLIEVPPTARLAYAKFMTPKLKMEYMNGQKPPIEGADTKVDVELHKPKDAEAEGSNSEVKVDTSETAPLSQKSPPVVKTATSFTVVDEKKQTELFDIPEECSRPSSSMSNYNTEVSKTPEKPEIPAKSEIQAKPEIPETPEKPEVKEEAPSEEPEKPSRPETPEKPEPKPTTSGTPTIDVTESKSRSSTPSTTGSKKEKDNLTVPETGFKPRSDGKSKLSGNVRTGWI